VKHNFIEDVQERDENHRFINTKGEKYGLGKKSKSLKEKD
jgi:hypothetical protein